MATNTSKISVSELDFDLIKQELITYMRSQEEFSDYNFEGSSLNVLMDVLSYNTHMNAYMANMLGNEMFLDSASIRQSVVSKAKEIGYTPRSVRSSTALIDVTINNVTGSPLQITMDAGTIFDTSSKYTFVTKEDYILFPSEAEPTTYEIKDATVYDGNFVSFHYNVDVSDPDQQFMVPSVDADMSTLRVFIQPDNTSSQIEEYFINNDLNALTPDSKVFFTHETPEGYFEVTFGDGILGKDVINGNYITLTYIVAKGKEEANYIGTFIPIVSISGYGSYDVSTVEVSFGGAEKESIKDIKFLAPRMYQSQRRAVTVEDYETFLLHEYPWIDTINAWSGTDNEPPIYGKVFFSIKPKHTEFVSDKLKLEIINDLIKNYNVVTIIPEIVDPEYLYVNVDSNVFYYDHMTTLSGTELVNNVVDNIEQYFADTTEKFKMNFFFSPMTTIIDATDSSFSSSLSEVTIQKRLYLTVNTSQTFTIRFGNAIKAGTITSSMINPETYSDNEEFNDLVLMDDGLGTIKLVKFDTGIVVDSNIGSVDYETGVMTATIFIYNLPQDTLDLRIYATPESKNVDSIFNQIIIYDDSSANYKYNRRQGITVTLDKEV